MLMMRTAALLGVAMLSATPVKAQTFDYDDALIQQLVLAMSGANCGAPAPISIQQKAARMALAVYGDRAIGMLEALRLDLDKRFSQMPADLKADTCSKLQTAYKEMLAAQ